MRHYVPGDLKLILPVSRGPYAAESAISALARAYEGYDVSSVVMIYSDSEAADTLKDVVKVAKWLGLNVEKEQLPAEDLALRGGEEDPLARAVRKQIVERAGEAVAVVSPASRRVAAALALACYGSMVDVAHLHFYWGEWSGLPYPYTPRRLEPLVSMHTVRGFSEKPRNAARRMPDLEKENWLGLSPLRRSVAELARRINSQLESCVSETGKSIVELACGGVEGSWEANLCNEDETAGLTSQLSRFTSKHCDELGEALAWTGLASLRFIADGRLYEPGDKPLVIDATCFYHGVHNAAYRGIRVIVPECASWEVRRKLAEAVKRGRLENVKDLKSALAYLALEEVLAHGAAVYPSPVGVCDVAATKIDPILLEDVVLATGDDGAYRRWLRNPVSRIVGAVAKTSVDIREAELLSTSLKTTNLPRLYHGLYQLLLVLALAEKNGIIKRLVVRAAGTRVKPLLKPLEKALGLNG